jgi:hypothetical protein
MRSKSPATLAIVAGLALPGGHAEAQLVGSEFQVNTTISGNQSVTNRAVASDAAGDFVVSFYDGPTGSLRAYVRRYAADGTPLDPAELAANPTPELYNPYSTVARAGTGNFLVAWRGIANDFDVFARMLASDGSPVSAPFLVNDYTSGLQEGGSAAADATGNFVMVWNDRSGQDGSDSGIYAKRYDNTGAALTTQFQVNTFTAGPQHGPVAAFGTGGEFLVVWASEQDGSGNGIYAQRFAYDATMLGTEFRVSTFTPGDQSGPAVASDGLGNYLVAWHSDGQDGDGYGVYAQRLAPDGSPVGPEFRVNTTTVDAQTSPTLALTPAGELLVVWQSHGQDGSLGGIFGQMYGSAGTPAGSELQINSYTTGAQSFPNVAAVGASEFVVVWNSEAQDGSGAGVFGQRLAFTPESTIAGTSPGQLWVGLRNSDDQGTYFDLKAALYVNDALVSEGQTLCVTGITRNANKAKEVSVPFGPIVSEPSLASGDVVAVRLQTRIGTNPDGSKCGGHNNAVGLRLYYDAPTRPSRIGLEITPDALSDYFLHSNGSDFTIDTTAPTATPAKQKDSGPVNFAGGNAWVEIGTWSRTQP